jgi:hypothetical protein
MTNLMTSSGSDCKIKSRMKNTTYLRCLVFFLLVSCAQAPVKKSHYNRKDWPHWSDVDHDCQNTRQEILIARSLVPVSLDRKGCRVMKGKWNDYYYPEIHTVSDQVDIDHVIPLKHANDVGGDVWSKDEKEKFANDPENLVITNKSYNRKKGAKTIAEWLPVHAEYACKYIKDWVRLKKKYHLSLSHSEQNTISQAKCPN